MKKETIKLTDFLKDMGWDYPKKNRDILEIFYGEEENFPFKTTDPYKYVESVEQRGDGAGYEIFWIFERISDGKFFYYYSYDGRIEEYELSETTKKVVTQWDFETQY